MQNQIDREFKKKRLPDIYGLIDCEEHTGGLR